MFSTLKHKLNFSFFNLKKNNNDVYILENDITQHNYYINKNNTNNTNNNDIIINISNYTTDDIDNDIPILENNEYNNDYYLESNLYKYTHKNNTIYRFVKHRRLYKKYNYMNYPFYKNTK